MSSNRLPSFNYLRPSNLNEAYIMLHDYQSKSALLAGGTDLLVRMKQGLCNNNHIVSLNYIKGLNLIHYDEIDGLTIGPLTTISALLNQPIIKQNYECLYQAASQISAAPLRYVSTIGGNLCLGNRCIYYNQSSNWHKSKLACFKMDGNTCYAVKGGDKCYSVYQGDLAPALIALGASIKIGNTNGIKEILLTEFFTNSGILPNVLKPDDIIIQIKIPKYKNHVISSYKKLRIRESIDFPLVGVAVKLESDKKNTHQNISVVLGAVAPAPIELNRLDRYVKNGEINKSAINEVAEEAYRHAQPVNNLSINAIYRKKMIKILVKRAFEEALKKKII